MAAATAGRRAILGSCERLLPPLPLLLGDRQEQLEFRRELLLRVQAVGEVNPADTAVRVDLHPQSLDVVRAVRSAREVAKVELDLVPPLLKKGIRVVWLLVLIGRKQHLEMYGSLKAKTKMRQEGSFRLVALPALERKHATCGAEDYSWPGRTRCSQHTHTYDPRSTCM